MKINFTGLDAILLLFILCGLTWRCQHQDTIHFHPEPWVDFQVINLPTIPHHDTWILHAGKTDLPLQHITGDQWLVRTSPGDTSSSFTIEKGTEQPLSVAREDSILTITWQNHPVLSYHVGVTFPPSGKPDYYRRSGFSHPVYTPQGQIITDDFPEDHEHQHGWFYALTHTHFRDSLIDFWNQQSGLGTVSLRSLDSVQTGPVKVDIYATLDHISTQFGPILEEKWHLQVLPGSRYHTFYWESILTNITSDTLFADDYLYGGLGMRGPAAWNDMDTLHFQERALALTSEGKDVLEGNHSHPLWAAMYGKLGAQYAGWAIIDQPGNINYPQPVRIHPEMPYFCKAPMVDHPYVLAPQQPMTLRYILVTFDGMPDPDLLNQLTSSLPNLF